MQQQRVAKSTSALEVVGQYIEKAVGGYEKFQSK